MWNILINQKYKYTNDGKMKNWWKTSIKIVVLRESPLLRGKVGVWVDESIRNDISFLIPLKRISDYGKWIAGKCSKHTFISILLGENKQSYPQAQKGVHTLHILIGLHGDIRDASVLSIWKSAEWNW